MKVRSSLRVTNALLEIEDYYARRGFTAAGDRKIATIVAAMDKLATNHNTRRTADDLPLNYRRALAGNYLVFYVVKPDYVLIYDVRYAGRKPLSSSTHRRHAAEAERQSFPLLPPKPNPN